MSHDLWIDEILFVLYMSMFDWLLIQQFRRKADNKFSKIIG